MDSTPPGRFATGEQIAGRYRIVALLGRGGMGEVYRADDLQLGVAVALKFLPERLERDADLRARLLQEVRMARQVAHPNVCRVFDVGERDGRAFVSMEYVDGEDLGRLLARVGRLTGERAIQIAQQIAAGLAAAHDQGILHRDLKPANVMIDGRGRARLMDFGLAGISTTITGAEVRAGTPVYMAPEQLAGAGVSVQSDLYALGLVYYELFTGRRAFTDVPFDALATQRSRTTPATPASLVPDLPESVERVILRCLETEPARRPTSALAVARALPGGDPLAAAIAAGELPSPELLAEAGHSDGLSKRAGALWLALLLASLAGILATTPTADVVARVAPPLPAAVLQNRAREVAERLGWSEPGHDRAGAFLFDAAGAAWVTSHDTLRAQGDPFKSPMRHWLFNYWYRQSPVALIPKGSFQSGVTPEDPPIQWSGELLCTVSAQGRLRRFRAVPPQFGDTVAAPHSPAWGVVFAEAGLDSTRFREVTPYWQPEMFSTARRAWEGVDTATAMPIRLEAAAYRERIVSVRVLRPWMRPDALGGDDTPAWLRIFSVCLAVSLFALMLVLTRTGLANLKSGTGDKRGAMRLALGLIGASAVLMLLSAKFVLNGGFFMQVVAGIGPYLVLGYLQWIGYLALEPILRRAYPDMFVSWVRALDARWRDPRVARDVLIGLAFGTLQHAIERAIVSVPLWLGRVAAAPDPFKLTENRASVLASVAGGIAVVPAALVNGLLATLIVLLMMLGAYRFAKKPLPHFALSVLLALPFTNAITGVLSTTIVGVLVTTGAVALLFRVGPLALLAFSAANLFARSLPTTLDSQSWFFPWTVFLVAGLGIAGLVAWTLATSPRPMLPARDDSGASSRPPRGGSLPPAPMPSPGPPDSPLSSAPTVASR